MNEWFHILVIGLGIFLLSLIVYSIFGLSAQIWTALGIGAGAYYGWCIARKGRR